MPPKIWRSDENTPWNPPSHRAAKLAIAAGLTTAAGVGLATTQVGQGVAMDYVYKSLRHAGNISPFSILNTFRASQWLSPWISPHAQGLVPGSALNLSGALPGGSNTRYYHIGEEFLSDKASTGEFLRRTVGEERYRAARLDLQPFELLYGREAANRTGAGVLWSRIAGEKEWQVLSRSTALFEATAVDPVIAATRTIQQEAMNPAAVSIFDALGATEQWGVDAERMTNRAYRASSLDKQGPLARLIPMPALFGPLEGNFKNLEGITAGLKDIGRRAAAYGGSMGAFGMARFNRLLQQTTEQLPILNNLSYSFQRAFKTSLGVTPGPASKMFARFGLRAAAIGGIGVGIAQVDWARRNYGPLGHLAATGITTAGLTYAVHKMFNNPRLTLGVGAASAIGQLVLPGFKEGLVPGAASTVGNLNIIKSGIGAITFMNSYRRTMEGFAPGISDWKTSLLVGMGVAGASYAGGSAALIKKYGYGGILPASLENFIGVDKSLFHAGMEPPLTFRQTYAEELQGLASRELGPEFTSIMGRKEWAFVKNKRLYAALHKRAIERGDWHRVSDEMDLVFERASTRFGQFVSGEGGHPLYKSLLNRIGDIENSNMGTAKKFIAKAGTKLWHAFLGANPKASALREQLSLLPGGTSRLGRLGMLVGAGALGWSALTGGLLGSMESPGELADIYAGRKHVEIREGRGWEAGGTRYGGEKVLYTRPSNLFLLKTRAGAAAAWGEGEDEISPIKKFLLKNFTYEHERRMGRDRPTPITSGFMEGIPIIGGLIASTVGQIIKPPKLMYVNDWVRTGPTGDLEFAHIASPDEPAYDMGGLPPGAPHSPFTAAFQMGMADYNYKELAGLGGFALNTATKQITGSETFATQRPVLDSSGSITSAMRGWWNLELAGAAGLSEGVRRFLPHKRSEEETYNPIMNSQPSWLPERFIVGDPYRCVTFDTPIECNNINIIEASKLLIEDQVRSVDGTIVPITKISKRVMDVGERLFSLKVATLPAFEYKVSEEHPFWTEFGWQQAQYITTKTFVGYPLPRLDSLLNSVTRIDISLYLDSKDFIITDNWIYTDKSSSNLIDIFEWLEKFGIPSFKWGERKSFLLKNNWDPKEYEHAVTKYQKHITKQFEARRIPRFINSDTKEWGIFLGYYVAEGCCSSNYIKFTFDKNEIEFVQEVISATSAIFKIGGCLYERDTWTDYIVNNQAVGQFIEKYIGRGTSNKRLKLSIGNYKDFFRTLFNGDGCVFIDNEKLMVSLKQRNINLLYYLRQILLSLGMVASINTETLILRGSSAQQFCEFFNFDKFFKQSLLFKSYSKKQKNSYWHIKDNYLFMRVLSICEIPQEPLISIQVNTGHSFCVAGVATHNTIDRGEIRLPGAGFAAIHPELKGMAPEDYPDAYKYMILADVDHSSKEFLRVREKMYQRRATGATTESENRMMDLADERLNQVLSYQQFDNVHPKAIQIPGLSRVTQGAWNTAQKVVRAGVMPVESLTPLRPMQKLMANRDMFEEYQYQEIGGGQAFWDQPYRDFIRPAMYASMNMVTPGNVKPLWKKKVEEDQEYFDKLEFVKWMQIAEQSTGRERQAALNKANRTRYGVNPQGSPLAIYNSLPEKEKKFFDAFAYAQGSERDKILEMIPEDQRHLYKSLWGRIDSGDKTLYPGSITQADEAYLTQRFNDLQGFFEDKPYPKEDWIGFNQNVSLQDIQLKYVERLGADIHDYEMWEKQNRALSRKPYLEGSEDFLFQGHPMNRDNIAAKVYNAGKFDGRNSPQVSVHSTNGSLFGTQGRFYYDDNREPKIMEMLNALI